MCTPLPVDVFPNGINDYLDYGSFTLQSATEAGANLSQTKCINTAKPGDIRRATNHKEQGRLYLPLSVGVSHQPKLVAVYLLKTHNITLRNMSAKSVRNLEFINKPSLKG